MSSYFPKFGKFLAFISLNKLSAPFSLLFFWDTHYTYISLPDGIEYFLYNFFIS